eukprot:tig00021719_g23155.t1
MGFLDQVSAAAQSLDNLATKAQAALDKLKSDEEEEEDETVADEGEEEEEDQSPEEEEDEEAVEITGRVTFSESNQEELSFCGCGRAEADDQEVFEVSAEQSFDEIETL